MVRERGIRFSGGQRQRLKMACALYHDPDAIFFDEATSSLDGETETAALAALSGTRILISHRLTSLAGADVVNVLDEG